MTNILLGLLRGAFPFCIAGIDDVALGLGIGSLVSGTAVGVGNMMMGSDLNRENRRWAEQQNATARDFAREQTQTQWSHQNDIMAWQEKLANSAYQRATSDMEKAGINPALAYMKGGADSPSPGGAGAQGASSMGASSSAPRFDNPVSAAMSSALEYRRLQNENLSTAADINKKAADAKYAEASAKQAEATAENVRAQIPHTKRVSQHGTVGASIGETADKVAEGVSSSANSFKKIIDDTWSRRNEERQRAFDQRNNAELPSRGR